ncbi:DUF924 family protein [Roseibium aggregatum]|uniref:DUF924 domain-containing protein n=1 Tax=Roseibium aggregatum TaxID=187304 RepID=A0A926P0Q9_9HYPH|nr:DUF924 family protein [Roseibium aggregatum]MBD1546838.1 DUF924 domain-containing protein [Roseibium aggregatum]
MSETLANPIDVLDFWWQAGASKWFARDDNFDRKIRERFLTTIEAGQRGELDAWADTAHGALALILLLDQFTRNIFRNDRRAFEADALALSIAKESVARGYDKAFPKDVRAFFYFPFEHAEDMDAQQEGVDLFRKTDDRDFYLYALIHLDVIRRFGRFPHRNAVLGRETTPEEQAFLDDGGFSA